MLDSETHQACGRLLESGLAGPDLPRFPYVVVPGGQLTGRRAPLRVGERELAQPGNIHPNNVGEYDHRGSSNCA